SDAYSLWGSSTPVATGLSAGLEAIAYAAAAIRSGEEQAMIAGGYDEINLCNASVLATITTTSPAATYPVAGEGVAMLLLAAADACLGARGPLHCVAAVHALAGAAHTPEVSDTAAALVWSSGYDGTFAATVFRGCPA